MPNMHVPATGEAMPIANEAEKESPYAKVRRLARELSDALAECDERFGYSFVEVHAKTATGDRPVYFSCMTAQERLGYHARCFAQAAHEIDPEAVEYGLFSGEEGHPTRFAVFVSAKQRSGGARKSGYQGERQ